VYRETVLAALGEAAGRGVDRLIRAWVRILGTPVPPSATWLLGPVAASSVVGPTFYDRYATSSGLRVREESDAGLLVDFGVLGSPEFEVSRVHPDVRDFYEHTARYDMAVTGRWSLLFQPLGWAIISLISRRVDNVNLPLRPADTAQGMSSRVITLVDPVTDLPVLACWLRRMNATGAVIYAGFYTTDTPPGSDRRCVKVVFPLPQGSINVLLRPELRAGGAVELVSSGRRFGDPGYYRVIRHRDGRTHARYIRALKEYIHVYVDRHGELRTAHRFRFFRVAILSLDYRIWRR